MVSVEDAKKFREQMAKPALVFLTPGNEEKIKEAMAPAMRIKIEAEEKEHAERQAKLARVTEMIKEDAETQRRNKEKLT